MVILCCQGKLPQVVRTVGFASRLACHLHGRQDERSKNADDSQDHQ
jgi:hypothetical protein